MNDKSKLRLDQLLTLRGLAATRSRARDLIKRGLVTVSGAAESRPGAQFPPDAELAVTEAWSGYVSRGALKLAAALDAFGFEGEDRAALDIGASTGGFTQLLLRRGARRVFAVDVGTGQLHPTLAADSRVVNLEGLDARRLDASHVTEPVGAVTADVSFISLTKVLPAALAFAAPGAWAVGLVKPQFEAGRERIGKGGVVRSQAAREDALNGVAEVLQKQAGWRVVGAIPSPIAGQSGNLEYLIGARYAP